MRRAVLAAAAAIAAALTLAMSPPVPRQDIEPVQVRVVVVGDIMLGRKVNIGSLDRGDFRWPFRATADVLRAADLATGNLESPIIQLCPPIDHSMLFCGDMRSIQGLAWAGFDALGLANNHRWDKGQAGFEQTVSALEAAGIAPYYDGRMYVYEEYGATVGLMAFNDVLWPLDLEETSALVRQAAAQVDVLIGLVHMGEEYFAEPWPRQVEIAHALTDAGMDIVVGGHPHWVQTVGSYAGRPIFYSLGNFVFDQMWSDETRRGDILRLDITVFDDGSHSVTYALIPVTIYDNGQPRLGGVPIPELYADN
jgi:poly-gamma-glutamate synthesis protein (capsule biosynthesis protein)